MILLLLFILGSCVVYPRYNNRVYEYQIKEFQNRYDVQTPDSCAAEAQEKE